MGGLQCNIKLFMECPIDHKKIFNVSKMSLMRTYALTNGHFLCIIFTEIFCVQWVPQKLRQLYKMAYWYLGMVWNSVVHRGTNFYKGR